METATGVPLRTYLASAYRPDREFVEGEIIERNVGERDHSRLQMLLVGFFLELRKNLKIEGLPEQRVQVKPDRFRVPDVCVVRLEPYEKIITTPPLICIEILSPEDRMTQMQERIDDYLSFGVPHVWLLNPEARKAYVCTREGMREVRDPVLRIDDPPVELPIAGLFAQLG